MHVLFLLAFCCAFAVVYTQDICEPFCWTSIDCTAEPYEPYHCDHTFINGPSCQEFTTLCDACENPCVEAFFSLDSTADDWFNNHLKCTTGLCTESPTHSPITAGTPTESPTPAPTHACTQFNCQSDCTLYPPEQVYCDASPLFMCTNTDNTCDACCTADDIIRDELGLNWYGSPTQSIFDTYCHYGQCPTTPTWISIPAPHPSTSPTKTPTERPTDSPTTLQPTMHPTQATTILSETPTDTPIMLESIPPTEAPSTGSITTITDTLTTLQRTIHTTEATTTLSETLTDTPTMLESMPPTEALSTGSITTITVAQSLNPTVNPTWTLTFGPTYVTHNEDTLYTSNDNANEDEQSTKDHTNAMLTMVMIGVGGFICLFLLLAACAFTKDHKQQKVQEQVVEHISHDILPPVHEDNIALPMQTNRPQKRIEEVYTPSSDGIVHETGSDFKFPKEQNGLHFVTKGGPQMDADNDVIALPGTGTRVTGNDDDELQTDSDDDVIIGYNPTTRGPSDIDGEEDIPAAPPLPPVSMDDGVGGNVTGFALPSTMQYGYGEDDEDVDVDVPPAPLPPPEYNPNAQIF